MRPVIAACLAVVVLAVTGCHAWRGDKREIAPRSPSSLAETYFPSPRVSRPPALPRGFWAKEPPRGTFRNLRKPTHIVLACDPTFDRKQDNPADYLDQVRVRLWKEHGWGDVPAQYYILDGETLFVGRDERTAGVTRSGLDLSDACLITILGQFEDQPPPVDLMVLLSRLAAYICDKHLIPPDRIIAAHDVDPAEPPLGQYAENYLRTGWLEREVRGRIDKAYQRAK